MRIRIITAALLTAAALAWQIAPAAARTSAPDSSAMTRQLEDPRTQNAAANALGSLMSIMLAMKAEPLIKAMDAMGEHDAARRIPRGATLGDLAGPDARRIPGEVKRRVPGMMTAMGSMAGMFDQLLPQLEQIGAQFDRDMAAAN